jgi:cytochrome c oxidase assembly protein subunit 15
MDPARAALKSSEGRAAGAVALPSRLALVSALLMLCLVSVSAYLRLSAAQLGCQPWPDCYTQAFHQAASADTQYHPVARLTHRVLASAIGVAVLLLVFASFVRRSQRPGQFWIALAALALTAALAALGRTTPGTTHPGIASGNLLGGLALLALLTWLAFDAVVAVEHERRVRLPMRLLAGATLALLAAQVFVGAMVSTLGMAAACPDLTECGARSPLHLVHRALALTLLALGGALCVVLWRAGGFARGLASMLLVFAALQIGIGAAMVSSQFPLWLGLLHNLGAALLTMIAVWSARWASRS